MQLSNTMWHDCHIGRGYRGTEREIAAVVNTNCATRSLSGFLREHFVRKAVLRWFDPIWVLVIHGAWD